MFWAGYEQTGASFNLFAERYTDRHIFGWDMPASWLQAVDPLFVILFAPVFAALWIALGRRGRDFNAAAKFGAGLILLAWAFLVMYCAAQYNARRPDGAAHLAGADLPAALLRGAVPVAGGTVVLQQARAARASWAGHGHVVPVHGARQQSRRPALRPSTTRVISSRSRPCS